MRLRIERDTEAENPRTSWDHMATMVCSHRNYRLGDERADIAEINELTLREDVLSLALYLYDHSGMTMSTRPFSCLFDSAQVGIIYLTLEQVRKEYGDDSAESREKAIKLMECEVTEYDQYLTGEVYGYVVEDDDGNHVESCWGFYGRAYCEEQGQEALASAELAGETAVAECMP